MTFLVKKKILKNEKEKAWPLTQQISETQWLSTTIKTQKPSKTTVSAKPTNLAKQWRQQSPQTPSTHKPKTSNHGSHTSTNSQTFQTHKIFITSLLCGFVTICHRPPHNRPKTNNQNQNSNTPTKRKPISSITNPNQNRPTTKPTTMGPPQRQRERWNQRTYHHDATEQMKKELEVMDWKVRGRERNYKLKREARGSEEEREKRRKRK